MTLGINGIIGVVESGNLLTGKAGLYSYGMRNERSDPETASLSFRCELLIRQELEDMLS